MNNISKKEIIVECILWLFVILLAAFWSMNATSVTGKIASSLHVVFTCVVIPFYISNRLLTPKFLIRKRIGLFVFSTVLLLIFNPIFAYSISHLHQLLNKVNTASIDSNSLKRSLFVLFWNTLLAVAIGTGSRLLLHYFSTERRIKEIEAQKLKAELNFLRAQVNPHFLFNVLNNLYFQIDKHNVQARDYVEKLSEILRYQLQIEHVETVPIEKEIRYLRSFSDIQRQRLETGTIVNIEIDDTIKNIEIAPLLFIPIIENAFKYVSKKTPGSDNFIDIKLYVDNGTDLVLHVENSIEPSYEVHALPHRRTGIGLRNLEKRLAIIYPNSYTLTNTLSENVYSCTLKIQGII